MPAENISVCRTAIGLTVKLTSMSDGWWRASAVYRDRDGRPRVATIYDTGRNAAWAKLMAHISETEDVIACIA